MEKEQLTRKIARYVAQARPEEIPPEIYGHAKVAFLDWLGVTLAGKEEPLVRKLLKYTDLLGGKEQASILGHGVKRNVSFAALVNGSASHALDYDDTLRLFLGHPSVTLFPGVLAWAEWQGKTGKDLLQAYLIGFEVGARIGACAGHEHYLAGWHATSTIGKMASAAACSKLMGLDEQQTLYALGIAGTQTCGLKRVFGTMCKPLHAGAASQGGLMAAMLAAEGFDSAEDILEGPQGFFQAFHGQPHDSVATLGKKWEVEGIDQKYHASCHFTHSPIEAVLEIANREKLDISKIRSVQVGVSRLALETAGKTEPTTGLEGKFSIRYCVANALARRETGLAAFGDEKVNEPAFRKFMDKVSIVVDPELTDMSWLSKARIQTDSGAVYQSAVDVSTKTYDLATRQRNITAKFLDLAGPVVDAAKAKGLVETVLTMETADVRRLVSSIG